jgi:tetratricopeptide (TPR) repeat protein
LVKGRPILIGSPPREADCFQERNEENQLQEKLRSLHLSTSACLLIGPGGVGKSQIAAHYARKELAERSVDVAVWITANSRESVQTSYANAINAITGAESSGAESAAVKFLAWAQTAELKWLVVLDDLTAPATLRGLWPPVSENGKVVVTTRRRDAALSGPRWCRIPVGLFNADESLRYLTEKLSAGGRADNARDLSELAEDLHYLPLALAQSAAYLIDSGLDCSRYRELLADRRHSLSALLPDKDSLPDDHGHIVTATWSLSMEQADSLAPQGLARPILHIASMLRPGGSPEAVFETAAVTEYVATWTSSEAAKWIPDGQIKTALRNLHRLHLIDVDAAATPGLEIRMHGLVQRAVIETLDEEQYKEAVNAAADGLVEVWPERSSQSDLVRALRANADFLSKQSLPSLIEEYSHDVLFRYGESLRDAGLSFAAVDHFRMLRSLAEEIDPARWDVLFLRLEVADSLEDSGQIAEALEEYELLLQDELGRENCDEKSVLLIRSSLAECMGRAGDAQGSVRAFEELLQETVRVYGPDDGRAFDTRRRLVGARSAAGDVAGAIATCAELLEDEIRVNGRDHVDTRHTQLHLADEIGAAGDVVGAIDILEAMLQQVTRLHDEHHEETFSIRHHLAKWYAEDERYSKAAKVTRSLLKDEAEFYGDSHPYVLDIQSHLADYVGAGGDADAALEISKEVLEKNLAERGPHHPDTLDARGLVAHWKGRSGKAVEASREYVELLKDCEVTLGPDHPMTVRMVMLSASWLRDIGDMQSALLAYQRLVSDRERIHGRDDVRTLTALDYLAFQMLLMGEKEKALEIFRGLYVRQIRILGDDHPDTLHTREHIEELET